MRNLIIVSLAILSLASCQKEGLEVKTSQTETGEIFIGVRQADEIEMSTRATLISNLPSTLYWSATSGSGTETSVYGNTSSSVSSGAIATGKYQKTEKPTYNWYVSNGSITFAAGGSTIAASNSTDLFAGCVSSNSSTPAVTLNHIFAALGAIEVTAPAGYTASGISMSIKAKTGGTYNIKSGTFSGGSEESSSTTLLSGNITTAGGKVSSTASNKLTIPGSYTLSVSYTLSRGDYSEDFSKTATVNLAGGKVNAIKATLPGGNAEEIKIKVTLTPWGDNTININNGQSGAISWNS